MQHEELLVQNQRMKLQVRNLGRISAERKQEIRGRAAELRASTQAGSY